MMGLSTDQIGDFENTPIFPSEENWLGFQPRLSFPFGQETMPSSGFQTVFSITQSDQPMLHLELSAIKILEMTTDQDFLLALI